MEDYFIVSIALQSLCFVYWASISFYFYRQDTKERHQQKLDAILRETQHRPNNSAFTGFAQLTFRCSIWYSVIEAVSVFLNIGDNGLSFHPSTQTAVNVISINVMFMDTLYLSIFTVLCILYTASFLHSFVLHNFTSNRINGFFERLQPILFEVLLIPSLSTFLSVLHCNADGQTVGELESVQYFDIGHIALLTFGLIMVSIISFYALHLNQQQAVDDELENDIDSNSNSKSKPKPKPKQKFVFMHRFIVQWQTWQIAMAGIKTFFVDQVIVVLILMAMMSVYMEWLILKHQPCLGTGNMFNAHFAGAFAVILYSTFVAAFILILGDFTFIGLSEILLIIGIPPVIYGAYRFSQKRQRKLDAELLSECDRIFDSTLNLKKRIGIAQSALILSMTASSASGVMNVLFNEHHLPTLLQILGDTKKETLSTVLCQCLTNLAVISEEYRHCMFGTKNLIRTLLRHLNSNRSSVVSRKFPRSLLGLFNNLTIDFTEFSPFITRKVILDIANSLVDDQLRSISAQLILSFVAAKELKKEDDNRDAMEKQKQIKEWLISTPMIFRRIWFIIDQPKDKRLRQKGLEILFESADCKTRAEALFRCKAFDIDVIRDMDTVTSKRFLKRLTRLHFIPTRSIKLKSAALNGNEKDGDGAIKGKFKALIQKLKTKLGQLSDYIAVSDGISTRRPSKHAVLVEQVSMDRELHKV